MARRRDGQGGQQRSGKLRRLEPDGLDLAARATVLGVPLNFDRLYSDADPTYLTWARAWVNEVEEIKAQMTDAL